MNPTLILILLLKAPVDLYPLPPQDVETKVTLDSLNVLVGEWTVTHETRLSSSGPLETSQGKSSIARTVGRSVLEEDFAGEREGHPFFTRTIIAVNNQTDKFQMVFVDSGHGTLIEYEGQLERKTITFDRKWVYANSGTVKLRTIYRTISPAEFSVEHMRMPENTNTWGITERLKYLRNK